MENWDAHSKQKDQISKISAMWKRDRCSLSARRQGGECLYRVLKIMLVDGQLGLKEISWKKSGALIKIKFILMTFSILLWERDQVISLKVLIPAPVDTRAHPQAYSVRVLLYIFILSCYLPFGNSMGMCRRGVRRKRRPKRFWLYTSQTSTKNISMAASKIWSIERSVPK